MIVVFKPLVSLETPPGVYMGYGIIAAGLLGLVLSLHEQSESTASEGDLAPDRRLPG